MWYRGAQNNEENLNLDWNQMNASYDDFVSYKKLLVTELTKSIENLFFLRFKDAFNTHYLGSGV